MILKELVGGVRGGERTLKWSKIDVLVNNRLANDDKFRFNIMNNCGYRKCLDLNRDLKIT